MRNDRTVGLSISIPIDLVNQLDKEVIGMPAEPRANGRVGMKLAGFTRRNRSGAIEYIIREWLAAAIKREAEEDAEAEGKAAAEAALR